MTTPLNDSIPEGLCQCGCGRRTGISRQNDTRCGYIKGVPQRFLPGHANRSRVVPEGAIPFKIEGIYCRLIPLSKGMYAIVDQTDYWHLARFKWVAHWDSKGKTFYATRRGPTINGKQTTISMHREVLGLKRGDPKEVDHIEPENGCDNRRKNLREATHTENTQNRRVLSSSITGLKGVSWLPELRKYRVVITANKVRRHIGYFPETQKEQAAAAYAQAARMLHGQFGRP